eukprot:14559180-Alexandrium_andersonii.AAC.1
MASSPSGAKEGPSGLHDGCGFARKSRLRTERLQQHGTVGCCWSGSVTLSLSLSIDPPDRAMRSMRQAGQVASAFSPPSLAAIRALA